MAITFRLADAITDDGPWDVRCGVYFLAYEHFARLLADRPKIPKHVMILTSGRGHRSLGPLIDRGHPRRVLRAMAARAGDRTTDHGQFLWDIGIKKWADLQLPIGLRAHEPRIESGWFDLLGRTFWYPGPNECHPKATTAYYGAFRFCIHRCRWDFFVNYSYPEDSSSWEARLEQKPGQSLSGFCKAIGPWLEKVLEPDDDPRHRLYMQRQSAGKMKTIEDLFTTTSVRDDVLAKRLRDRLLRIDPSGVRIQHRLQMTEVRWQTLLCWAERDVEASRKKKATEKKATEKKAGRR